MPKKSEGKASQARDVRRHSTCTALVGRCEDSALLPVMTESGND